MDPVIIRRGSNVSLALVQKDNLPKMQIWINDPDVNRNLRYPGGIYYPEDEEKWYESMIANKNTNRIFAILINDTRELTGVAGLHNFDPIGRHAEIGYLIGKEHWKKGIGTEAVKLIIEYGKDAWNLRKVYANVNFGNEGSIKVLEKNGLVYCGKLTKHSFVPGKGFVDLLRYEKFLE